MKNRNKLFFIYLILGGFIIKTLAFLFKKKNQKTLSINFKNLLHEEKKEVKELANGEESVKKFCCDSGSILKDYFIPHKDNDHKPKILRAKSLIIIVVGLVFIKVAVTGYLFFIYPNQARMTELITNQILELINKDRKDNNLSVLSFNTILNEAALTKARDMINYDYFAHKSLNGKMPWDWINRGEYAYLFVGENLAMNFSSAQSAHNALMQSESHKKNILNKKYADIGLAVLPGVIDGKQTNILVEMFGYRKAPLIKEVKAEEVVMPKKQVANLPKTLDVEKEEVENNFIPESSNKTDVQQIEKQEIEIIPQKKMKVASANISPSENYISPNQNIENGKVTEVLSLNVKEDNKITTAAAMLKISHYIFLAVLCIVAIALLINIFVRISIQHKPIIIQSLLVIIFIVSLIQVRLHFLEQVLENIMIL